MRAALYHRQAFGGLRTPVGGAMEILLLENSLADARQTIFSIRQGEPKHRLTLMLDAAEAIEFLQQRGKYGQAPRPDLVVLADDAPQRRACDVLDCIKAEPTLHRVAVAVLIGDGPAGPPQIAPEDPRVARYWKRPLDALQFKSLVQRLRRFWLNDYLYLRHDSGAEQPANGCSSAPPPARP